jgi:hypothetical protein
VFEAGAAPCAIGLILDRRFCLRRDARAKNP